MRHLRTLEGERITPPSEKRTRNKPSSFPPWNKIAVLKISNSDSGGCLRVGSLYLARVQHTGGSEFQSPNLPKTVYAIEVPIAAALTRSKQSPSVVRAFEQVLEPGIFAIPSALFSLAGACNRNDGTWTSILVLHHCKVYNACVKPHDCPDPPRLNVITTVAAK